MRKENLITGKPYLLRILNRDGSEAPSNRWVVVEWNGNHLVSADGVWWDEWLSNDGEDILELPLTPATK